MYRWQYSELNVTRTFQNRGFTYDLDSCQISFPLTIRQIRNFEQKLYSMLNEPTLNLMDNF